MQKRASYTLRFKKQVLKALRTKSQRLVEFGIPRWTVRAWASAQQVIADRLALPKVSEKKRAMRFRVCKITLQSELVSYMKDVRREEKVLRTAIMIQFIKRRHQPWLQQYLASKSSVEKAVVGARAGGTKLPILFVIKGVRGGRIEKKELRHYPPEHHYMVQENAWVDSTVWHRYLREVLACEFFAPSVLLVDNLDCHVTDDAEEIIATELGSARLRALWLLEENDEKKTAKKKRRAIIIRMIRPWAGFPEETIKRSFEKALPKVREIFVHLTLVGMFGLMYMHKGPRLIFLGSS
ncbi:TPA: hypothetical protein N0F65_004845 [Lagenidium giganteum]|uniref:DDE-1 domain-containing protein n=1 Tax=Lagenidium giganteum TaxID=4803 RepID=A0AAV2Z6W1_9STRA|nr:TPA: hypothetical protein N0F65_004845 [Lagenidium giganteum]